MATLKDQIPEGTVATHNDGRTAVFRNGKWNLGGDPALVNIDRAAPGAAFLPEMRRDGGKSEEAYYRQFRDKDNTSVSAARKGIETARRMEGLLGKQQTGGIYGIPLVGDVAGLFDPEIREMDSIQAERSRQNRQPGEGAISDFDAQQFMNMTYGKDKPTETNRQLLQAQRMADDAAIQRRQFMEWHFDRFGSLSGAEEAWDHYAQDNPIFDLDAGGVTAGKLNSSRMNWRQYFGDVRGKADTRPTAAYEDIRRSKVQTPFDPRGAPQKQQQKPGNVIRYDAKGNRIQ